MKELQHVDFVKQQIETLTRAIKACAVRLSELRGQLDVPYEEQLRELEQITGRALQVWSAAVKQAEDDKQHLVNEVQDGLREISDIKEQLGDDLMSGGAAAELSDLQAPHQRTIKAWSNEVMGKLHYWRGVRDTRIQEHDQMQGRIVAKRRQLGLATAGDAPRDISNANMQFLQVELDNLEAEQGRRQERLGRALAALAAKAMELGEDGKAAAVAAHPSLGAVWDVDSQAVLQAVYSCTGDAGAAGGGPDLSDATFGGLELKLHDLDTLKAQREAHAAQLMGVLSSLWGAMGMPATCPDRAVFVRMMTSPLRLHQKSLEKCMAEVRRLEGVQLAQMVDLVRSKEVELRARCEETHVEPPVGLEGCMAALDSAADSPGSAANLLAALISMLAEVEKLAAKRGKLLQDVMGLELARKEAAWLRTYEGDAQRYKGRDASRNLARAIEAGKMREALGARMAQVAAALAEWREAEGAPFLYDGRDYEEEVLPQLQLEQAQMAADRAARSQARRQSGVGVGGSSSTKGRTPGAVGNRTPLPKEFGRHSIAVVRDDPHWNYGPRALNRSTTHLPMAALASPSLRRPSTASSSRGAAAPLPAAFAATPSRVPTTPAAAPRPSSSCGYTTPPGSVMAKSGPAAATPSPQAAAGSSGKGVGSSSGSKAGSGSVSRTPRTTSKMLDDILQRQALHDVAKLGSARAAAAVEAAGSAAAASPARPPAGAQGVGQAQVLDVEQEAREEQFKLLMGKKPSTGGRSRIDQNVSPTKKAMRGR